MNTVLSQESQLVNEYWNDEPFRPFAYYDKHMDCIRVQLVDCSFKEKRLNRFLTVLKANHTADERSVGLNIKGVRFLFNSLGLSHTGVYKITDLIDGLLRLYPDANVETVKRQFFPIFGDEDLKVSLA